MRYKASITIEAAYVMAILLFAIVFALQFAYTQRDDTLQSMITHELLEEAVHIEEGYAGSDIDTTISYGIDRMYGMGNLSGSEIEIKNSLGNVEAMSNSGSKEKSIKTDSFDPENWMRMVTSAKELLDNVSSEKSE